MYVILRIAHSHSLPLTDNVQSAKHPPVNESGVLSINNRLLPPGQAFQVVTLSSGERVPTGTVAAFLFNLKAYDDIYELQAGGSSGSSDLQEAQDSLELQAKKKDIEDDIRMSLPMLRKLGLFELFGVEEWGAGGAKPGRRFVAEEARRNGW